MNDLTRSLSELQALFEITREVSATLSQEEVLATLLKRMVNEFKYRAATLRLLNEEWQRLDLKAAYGLSEAYLTKGTVELAKSGIDRAVLRGRRVALADVTHDADFQYAEAAAREGLTSVLAVPLALRDSIMGVLRVYTADRHDFSREEQEYVAIAASLGAQAIQRTRLFEAFQRIAHEINSTLALNAVLTALLTESVKELNVKAGAIRLLGRRRARLHLVVAYGLSEAYIQKGDVNVANSPIDQIVLQEARFQTISDLEQEQGLQYLEAARTEGIRSLLVLPLRVRGVVIGVLRLYSGQVRHFSAEEISFASAVADLGAVAIENAKLHQALQQRLDEMKEDVDGWFRFLAFS